LFSQNADVDEVDGVAWLNEDGDKRERAVSRKIVAFEVDEESWLGVVLWRQTVEERLECCGGVDYFGFYVYRDWLSGRAYTDGGALCY